MNAVRTRDGEKYRLYLNAYCRTAKEYADNPTLDTHSVIKKLIFYGIKMVNTMPKRPTITPETAQSDFQLAEAIQAMIGTLTPGEFVTMFPITKDYDGHRYQCKDYFYTRDYINSLAQDKPISDSVPVTKLLWEYTNCEISIFLVNVLGFIDNLRRLEGQPSMMEAFCAEKGIKTYTMHTDPKGRQYMLDRETGKTFRVKKKLPRYLRPVRNLHKGRDITT